MYDLPINKNKIIDPFGRKIDYLRVSVTDRCDFRCLYCMSENMTFLPKSNLLTLEELDRLCSVFISCGIKRIRLTGGEPLVRKNLMWFISRLSSYVDSGDLDEITLTTNGSQLTKYADELAKNNIKRINVSLDTLDEDLFSKITRWGNLSKVLNGIEVAQKAGIKIKINIVALKNINDKEIPKIIEWAHNNGMDITVIETMPMGDIDGDRTENYLPLSGLRATLEKKYTLIDIPYKTGGPARYVKIKETGGILGFITPLSHNFCESCNRIRVTCTGTLYMCLGQEDAADLLAPIREGGDDSLIKEVIYEAISRKPKGHDFIIDRKHNKPSISRFMSVTGG